MNKRQGKVKVLHIITRLDMGGSSENTMLTVSGLDSKGYECVLVSGKTEDPQGAIAKYIHEKNINWVKVPQLMRKISPLLDFLAFWKLLRLIKKGNFDIVHTHSSKAGILGRWAARLVGVPVVVHTPHGHIFYGYFGRFLTRIFILTERFTAKITDKIITLTELGKREHVELGVAGPDKFVAIPSGIELQKFMNYRGDKEKARGELELTEPILLVGTISRLEPVKGIEYLIRAMKDVIEELPSAAAVIVGGGTLKKPLKRLAASLGLEEKVKFTDETRNVLPLMSALDLFVLPSLNEGMGRVLVEAMALGLPIVATKVGGIPEVVEDGKSGILVEPKNSEALVAAIRKLLWDQQMAKEMGEYGKRSVYPKYDAKTMVEKITKLYEELL